MDYREQVILENIPLVKNIASKFNVSNIGIDYGDLVNIGVIGLMDAYDKYEESKGVKFSTYATIRVKSHIIDEIRKLSPITRTDMQKVKQYNNCVDILSLKLNREPRVVEIADYMGLSLKEVTAIETTLNVLNMVSVDSVVGGSADNIVTIKDTLECDDLLPSDVVEEEEKISILAKCIDSLNDRDRLILSLYYFEELTLKEVGEVIGLSESRVSVLHNRALGTLRGYLEVSKYNYTGECVI